MPELPEVEVVRRSLEKKIVSLTISDVKIKYDNIIDQDKNYFLENVIGKRRVSMDRLGKFLIVNLNKGHILSHLRMEGKYFYLQQGEICNKHIHVIFYFDNGYMLCYQDTRKFGRMEYKLDDELHTTKPLKKVGIDLTKNSDFDILDLHKKIISKKIPIKTTLLDQSILSGLGNIYVDEVLHKSKINPHKKSNEITLGDLKNIIKYSKECFIKSINSGGTTIRSYTSELGVIGHNQDNLGVHTKEYCNVCNTKIIKDKIGGRGTYYCPKCQKL